MSSRWSDLNRLEAASSRARAQSARRVTIPSAPPTPLRGPFSTYVLIDGGIKVHEVPLTFPHMSNPTVRISLSKEEAIVTFCARSSLEPQKVRPMDSQKWVKKFNEMENPYDHLTSFKIGCQSQEGT